MHFRKRKNSEDGKIRVSTRLTFWFFIGKDHFNLNLPSFRLNYFGKQRYTSYIESNFNFELALIFFGVVYTYQKQIDL